MKRIALMFALFFLVALIFPVNAPAVCGNGNWTPQWDEECDYAADPTGCPEGQECTLECVCETVEECGNGILDSGEVCDGTDDDACPGKCMSDCTCPPPPMCGDDMVNQEDEVCDGTDDDACPGKCMSDCTCPPPPMCGDDMVNQEDEVCDGTDDDACPGKCMSDCTCPEPPGTCEPRTQGFWQRVCAGVYGNKLMHPETPENFSDPGLCADLMVRGNANSLPCVRSASQIAALKLNNKYGVLDVSCKVYYEDKMTVGDVLDKIDALNEEDCKAAADLAEAINSRDAL